MLCLNLSGWYILKFEWDLQSVGIVLNLVCSREIYDLYMLIYTEKKMAKVQAGQMGRAGSSML